MTTSNTCGDKELTFFSIDRTTDSTDKALTEEKVHVFIEQCFVFCCAVCYICSVRAGFDNKVHESFVYLVKKKMVQNGVLSIQNQFLQDFAGSECSL